MHDRHHDHDEPPAPFTVDEYLSAAADLPDPNRCPYCAEIITEHYTVPAWQRVSIERDDNGDLEIVDWTSYETGDQEGDSHWACAVYTHHFDTLEDLDREQREQHALRLATDEHSGTAAAIRAIYAHPADWSDAPTFAGRRSRMVRGIRQRDRWSYGKFAARYRNHAFFFKQPEPVTAPAIETERELAAAGIL